MIAVAGNATERFAVRRWQARYLVADGHPSPERLRERLDSILRGAEVIGPLAEQLRHIIDSRDPALVLVRRLAFDVAVDAGWSAEDIGAQCARALSVNLSRELVAGDPANIMRFASPSEHLARFLVDTATGVAAGCWYYASFAGLVALPASAAIRTALLADIDAGVSALRALNEDELSQVLATLGSRECRQVCEGVSRPTGPGGQTDTIERLAVAWCEHPAPSHLNAEPQLALWLIARADVPIGRNVVILAQACAAVGGALLRGEPTLEDLREAGAAPPNSLVTAKFLTALRTYPPALRDLSVRREEFADSTPFGGAFLLLDDLFALRLEELLTDWPEALATPPARALGLLLLGCCCLGERAPALFADPLWRSLFGISPQLTFEALAAWLEKLGRRRRRALSDAAGESDTGRHGALSADDRAALSPPPPLCRSWSRAVGSLAHRVLCRFARRIPGYAASHPRYLQLNFLAGSADLTGEPTRVVVRLGRPPLALMLNLTGLNRGSRDWPALDGRPFMLFTQE